jgi:nitrate reductase NapE component
MRADMHVLIYVCLLQNIFPSLGDLYKAELNMNKCSFIFYLLNMVIFPTLAVGLRYSFPVAYFSGHIASGSRSNQWGNNKDPKGNC